MGQNKREIIKYLYHEIPQRFFFRTAEIKKILKNDKKTAIFGLLWPKKWVKNQNNKK